MTKSEAGRLGGLATYRKYGRGHYSKIGKQGAMVFHSKYRISPVNLNNYAVVDRKTNRIISFLNGDDVRYHRGY